MKRNLSLLTLISLLFISPHLLADSSAEYDLWPGTQYTTDIPTHFEILGYNVGERITSHADMIQFFEALEKAASDRIKVFEYGRTWEGRQLIYVAIGNQANIADLDAFSANMQKIADPRITGEQQAKNLMNDMPASVWLEYGVHGNEISSTDAAMMTAWHLLAAPSDPVVQKIMANTIVFIDPAQNPDGRERFTSRYYSTVGLEHSSDRLSAEHNEPWPNGRSNHYLFDMNRDWLAVTQPETAGRIKVLNLYKPLVVIDLHEMGGDQSYYFAPPAQPFNPFMTQAQIDNIEAVGRNNASHFDSFGFDYFTREIFDAFYPGYGDSWPVFYGASASTYEVASSRGEIFKRKDGTNLTYKDTVQRHFVASISTAESVAENHDKLFNDFYQYQVSAIKQGQENKQRLFVFSDKTDRAGAHRLATLMAQHGVEVYQATESFKACGINYSAGAYYIDTAQPRGRFVTTTFNPQVDMAEDFVEEQERRRQRNLDDEIYDVTGWALPLMFNINTDSCNGAVKAASTRVKGDDKLPGSVQSIDNAVAYIIPWGDMAAGRFLTAALLQGLTVKSADKTFQLDNQKSYPAGSLIIERRTNPEDLLKLITNIANQSGAQVDAVDSSWVINGPSFGSGNTVTMTAPNIALAWDDPVSSLSAGSTRYVIERQFNYPVTAIRTDQLARADLSHYQVLILPSGDYQKSLGEAGAKNLHSWVKQGGVLITFGSATHYAADIDVGLLDIKRELAFNANEDDTKTEDEKSTTEGVLYSDKQDLLEASVNSDADPDFVAGILANIEVDQEHWLTAGVNEHLIGMVYGSDIYTPIKLKSGDNVAWFAGADNVLASGYLWEENKKQLAFKPYLVVQPSDKGMIVGFTQEPTTRAYLDGLNVVLMNSIFRASAHAAQN